MMADIKKNQAQRLLEKKIKETLARYAGEESALIGDGFDILRWARQGKLKFNENDGHDDKPFDYYNK